MTDDVSALLPAGPADICLVCMPFSSLRFPSIALGLLQGALRGAAVRVVSVYGNLLFARQVGYPAYRLVESVSVVKFLADWVFAGAAFPEHRPDDNAFLEDAARNWLRSFRRNERDPEAVFALVREFRSLREEARCFVERLADGLMRLEPRAIACTSAGAQHPAALAVLRRVREIAPGVVTVLGGSNCEGEMGRTLLHVCPWIDYAFSGEADQAVVPLCRTILRSGRSMDADILPPGVIGRRPNGEVTRPVRQVVSDLDALPDPVYDDYFALLARMPYRHAVRPTLLAETSRGCGWGERGGCTFCGLNGEGAQYRVKSPEAVLAQWKRLAQRYGIRGIELVDNMMPPAFLDTLLPRLETMCAPYDFFYETRSHLSRDAVRQLATAGGRWIQPGIESLHDSALRLMRKGVSALVNVRMLKYCRQFGVWPTWQILAAIPGEDDVWHQETAAMIPSLHHLHPPAGVIPVLFERFSAYHQRPEEFGLIFKPARAYRFIYPFDDHTLDDLAVFFADKSVGAGFGLDASAEPVLAGLKALKDAVSAWKQDASGASPARLEFTEHDSSIRIVDTRAGAVKRETLLSGMAAEVVRFCDTVRSRRQLEARFCPGGVTRDLDTTIKELIACRFVLGIGNRYISLPLGPEPPVPYAPADEYPGGACANRPMLAYVEGLIAMERDPMGSLGE